MNLGKAIKILLTEQDMSQKELAEKLESTESYVSHLIKGNVSCSVARLEVIAFCFNLKASELLERAERWREKEE